LLIAILGESYDRVQASADEEYHRDLASICLDVMSKADFDQLGFEGAAVVFYLKPAGDEDTSTDDTDAKSVSKRVVQQVQKDVNNAKQDLKQDLKQVQQDLKQMQQAQQDAQQDLKQDVKQMQVQMAAMAGMLTKLVDNSSTQ